MKTHIIENGVVVNTIMASVQEATEAYPAAEVVEASSGAIGDSWDGVIFTRPPSPTNPPTIAEIVAAMESLFDATAQSMRYDNRITCALRAGYVGPFQAEGLAFATWMDASNAAAYQMLAQVQAGTMAMPATTADALALLPSMVWP